MALRLIRDDLRRGEVAVCIIQFKVEHRGCGKGGSMNRQSLGVLELSSTNWRNKFWDSVVAFSCYGEVA